MERQRGTEKAMLCLAEKDKQLSETDMEQTGEIR
jgi:hypothetical protein